MKCDKRASATYPFQLAMVYIFLLFEIILSKTIQNVIIPFLSPVPSFSFLDLTRWIIDYRFGSIKTATATATCDICLNLIPRKKGSRWMDPIVIFSYSLDGRTKWKENICLSAIYPRITKAFIIIAIARFKYAAIIYDSLFNIKHTHVRANASVWILYGSHTLCRLSNTA